MKTEGQVRIPSGCAIAAMISRDGNKMSGETITNAMKPMHDRSNGLGGGFAGYGIYPEYKDFYAFHMFFDSRAARKGCEAFLKERFEIVQSEIIPTRKTPLITDEPIIWRYFVAPLKSLLTSMQLDEKEYVVRTVMKINTEMPGAYVFSSGKNMGTFKAVGYPEDIGIFYKLDEYEGYSWTAHGRYPTNTPGWWGGAHPFALLDSSVVHNGEISSGSHHVYFRLSAPQAESDSWRSCQRNCRPLLEHHCSKNRSCRSEKAHLLTNSVPQPSDHRTFLHCFRFQRRAYGAQ